MKPLVLTLLAASSVFYASSVQAASSSRITLPVGSHANMVVQTSNGNDAQILLVSDSLDSTKVVLNSNGSIIATPQYYPYGNSTAQLAQNPNNRYFTSQRKVTDVDSSIYNYNARYYSPDTGIFTQPDTLEGPNRFAYVSGNPSTKNDPSGHGPTIPPVERLERWYLNNPDLFPHQLSFDEQELNKQNTNKEYYENRFKGLELMWLANYYIKRNPYDAQGDEENNITYLSKDIYETSHYNKAVIAEGSANLSGTKKLLNNRAIATSKQSNFPADQEIQQNLFYHWKNNKNQSEEWTRANLAQRISRDLGICTDFCDFTAYVLSKQGIKSGIGGSAELNHSFALVNFGDTPTVVDTTWGAYIASFEDDKSGNNKYSRKYNTWFFETPWGNPFKIDLNKKIPE